MTKMILTLFYEAHATSIISASSPLSYISIITSVPPINSPSMYNWGMVGQELYTLTPLRILSSSRTLIVSKGCPTASRMRQAVLLKPHCGNILFPFIKSSILLFFTALSSFSRVASSKPPASLIRRKEACPTIPLLAGTKLCTIKHDVRQISTTRTALIVKI